MGTNDPTNTYVDLTLASAISSRKIRMDSRSTALLSSGTFLLGGSNLDAPSFAVGDNCCAVGTKLIVGTLIIPETGNVLSCYGSSYFSSDLSCGGNIVLTNSPSGGLVGSISATKTLNLTQTGDTYGQSSLTLSNGTPACGIEVKTTHSTITLSEIFLTTSTYSRVLRNESRS